MNFFKKMMPLALGLFLIAGASYSQVQQGQQTQQQITSEDVSDAELEKFVTTATQVQDIQRETRMKLQQMVKDEGLTFRRFQMIMMSKQNPQMADSIEVTEEEQEAFKTLQPKLTQMSQQNRQQLTQIIKDNGFTQQRFQKIARAMQSSQKLAQRFQKMQAEQMQSDNSSN